MAAEMVLDNGRLNKMRGDSNIVAQFPFLLISMPRKTGGGCCHKATVVPDFNAMRRAIVALPLDKRQAFKLAIGASKLTIQVLQGARVETVVI